MCARRHSNRDFRNPAVHELHDDDELHAGCGLRVREHAMCVTFLRVLLRVGTCGSALQRGHAELGTFHLHLARALAPLLGVAGVCHESNHLPQTALGRHVYHLADRRGLLMAEPRLHNLVVGDQLGRGP